MSHFVISVRLFFSKPSFLATSEQKNDLPSIGGIVISLPIASDVETNSSIILILLLLATIYNDKDDKIVKNWYFH